MASLPTPSSHISASVDVNSVPFMSDTRELSSYLHGRVQEISKRLCDRHCSWNSASMNRKTELETDPALRFLHECDMSSASGNIASIAEDSHNTIQVNDKQNRSTELDLENYMLVQNPWKKKMMEGSAMKIDPSFAEDNSAAMVNIDSASLSSRFKGDCKEEKDMCEFRHTEEGLGFLISYTECHDLKQIQSLSLLSNKLGQNSSTQVIKLLPHHDQTLLSHRELMENSPSSLAEGSAVRVSASAVRKLMMDSHHVQQLQTDRADEDIMFRNNAVHSAISSKLSELEETKKAFIITAEDDRNLFHPAENLNLRMPSLKDHICTSSDTSHLSTQMKKLVQPAQVSIPCLNLSCSSNSNNVHQDSVFPHRGNGKKQNHSETLDPSAEKNCHGYLRVSVSSVDSSECEDMRLNLAQFEKYSIAIAETSNFKASGEAMDGHQNTTTDVMDVCKKAYQEVVADCEGINHNTDGTGLGFGSERMNGTGLGFSSERMDGLDLLLHAVEMISDQKDCPTRLEKKKKKKKKKKKLWTSMEPVLSSSENLIPKRRKTCVWNDISDRIHEQNLSARPTSPSLIDLLPATRIDDECIRERKIDQLWCNNNGSSSYRVSMARFPIVRKRSLRFPTTVLTKEPHTVRRFKSLQDVSDAEFPRKKGSLVSERSTESEEDLVLMQRSRKHGFDAELRMERSMKHGFDEEALVLMQRSRKHGVDADLRMERSMKHGFDEEEEVTLQRSNKYGLDLTWKIGQKTDKEEQMYAARERGTSDHKKKKKQKQKQKKIKKKKSISKLQQHGYDYKMELKRAGGMDTYSLIHGMRQLHGTEDHQASAILYKNVTEMENIMEMKSVQGRDGDGDGDGDGEISLVSNSMKRERSHALPVKFSDSVLQSWKKKERSIKLE